MKRPLPGIGIVSIAALLVTGACSRPVDLTAPAGPWQFSGTLFALDGQQVAERLAGAELTLTSGDEVRARTTSDTSGHFEFSGVETGRFVLTISARGFATLTPDVNLDRSIRADFGLKRQ